MRSEICKMKHVGKSWPKSPHVADRCLHPELDIGEEEVRGEQAGDDGREDDCHLTWN